MSLIEALELVHHGQLAVDLVMLQEVMRPHPLHDDPLWMLKFLTEREWEVMRCIMDGLSTEQMADQFRVQRSNGSHPRAEPAHQAWGALATPGGRVDDRACLCRHLARSHALTRGGWASSPLDVETAPAADGSAARHQR